MKTYQPKGPKKGRGAPKTALRGVDLVVPRGSLFGLLGPNGAGKSTLINILAGLVRPTAGQALVWGHDVVAAPRASRLAIGVVPQELMLDPFFTPRELLELQSGLYGVPRAERRVDELLRIVGLEDKAEAQARSLSGGMRRRLMVAKAMVHAPPVLVLDEPTAGVDVELRRQLWANVVALNKAGVTVVITTHYLEEAQELCDTLAIIDRGQVVACEPKEKLLSRMDSKRLVLTLDRPVEAIPAGLGAFGQARVEANRVILDYAPSKAHAGQAIQAVQAAGFGIVEVTTAESRLEDVFMRLTGAGAAVGMGAQGAAATSLAA